jgi:HD-like signal output (HDOD) protein
MDHFWDLSIVPLPASSTQDAPVVATEARAQEPEAPQNVATRLKTARATAAAMMAISTGDRTSAQQAEMSTGGSARSSRQAGNQDKINLSKEKESSKKANGMSIIIYKYKRRCMN